MHFSLRTLTAMARSRRRQPYRPRLEALEERVLMTGPAPQAMFTRTGIAGTQIASLASGRGLQKFAEVIDHPSDLGVLYRANLFLVTGLELAEQTMRNIDNYHHGREYTSRVPWNKIYYDFPVFSPAW